MNFHRLLILIRKEVFQLWRDPYSLTIGILLPIVLLLLFGYGMSLDLKDVRLAIVVPQRSAEATRITAAFRSSGYFIVSEEISSAQAEEAIRFHRADAALQLPPDLGRRAGTGELKLLLVVNATNANQARLTENYVRGVLGGALGGNSFLPGGPAVAVSRVWFNEANDSRYFLVPGVIVIITTLIGTMLTSLVMAREYEHGNLESLFITPVRPIEILVAKAVNNFLLGVLGVGIALLAVHFLFGVPIRGSVPVLLAGTGLYLLVSLGLGLLISTVAKNQFVACQLTLVLTFMPAFMLSGFLYEINNMPTVIQWITFLVPARYYVDFLQTVCLAGNVWSLILKDLAALGVFGVIFLALARLKTPKLLE